MNSEKSTWHRAVPGQLILSNKVHVWRVLLHEHSSHIESIKRNLSTNELVRAGEFRFEKDRNRFVMARGILRMILAGYLGMKPQELRFEYTLFGRPLVAENNNNDSISFNLSHSDNVVLYAVTLNRNIGIDVERIKNSIDVVRIANSFFSPGEINELEICNMENRAELFFQYWTRKEALVKAMGKGVSFPMEQCDVSLISGRMVSSVTLPGDDTKSSCWNVQDLFAAPGYAAAIAVDRVDWDLSCWHYSL